MNSILPGLLGLVLFSWPSGSVQADSDARAPGPVPMTAINAVIGDASWIARFGSAPDGSATERERIQTHLRFVLAQLRARDISHLGPGQKLRRRTALDTLQSYIDQGRFPRRGLDNYPGRRPRFIDDRGTHCAVGYLIAASGAPDLARALDARYEYAYVADMDSPALLAWAADHGFTVRELATIQPGYDAPPTRDSMRRTIEDAKEGLTLECARQHKPPKKIRIRVQGDDHGRATVSTTSRDPFARCFAKLASRLERGGGAYDVMPRPYRFQVWLTIPRPQTVLEQRLQELRFDGRNTRCLPRPGAVPTAADFDIRTTEQSLAVTVTTRPRNTEVQTCLERELADRLRFFGPGTWRLAVRETRALEPRINTRSLQHSVRDYAPSAVNACYRDDTRKIPMRFTVEARKDAEQFAIAVTGLDDPLEEPLQACLRSKLHERLHRDYSVWNDRTQKRYFRIDGDATATYTLEAESRAAWEKKRPRPRRKREKPKRYH